MNGTRQRLVSWLGVDPQRIEAAHVWFRDDSLSALSSSTTPTYVSHYELETESAWITRRLHLDVRGIGWERSLELCRADEQWVATWSGDGVESRYPGLGYRIVGAESVL